jgi:carbon monoxide dehydrogenase subunit G
MALEHSLSLAALPDEVWAVLIDLERAIPCVPGATSQGRGEDGEHAGSLKVKLGPASAHFIGTVQLEDVDEHARSAVVRAEGQDRRGQGGAAVSVAFRVSSAEDTATGVTLTTDYHLTGRLARFGRDRTVEQLADELAREFGLSLAAALTAARKKATGQKTPEPAPTQITPAAPVTPLPPAALPARKAPGRFALAGSAVWDQAKGNALQIASLVLGFLLALRVLGRRDD